MPQQDAPPVLRLERHFDVPPEAVFDMLTDPARMSVWWGDDARFNLDVRVGGQWTIVRREGESELRATGAYLEVERPGRLKYTFAVPQISPATDTITVEITPRDGGSTMVFEQSGVGIAEELRALGPGETSATEAGWQQGFEFMVAAWTRWG